jgi:hypothetical protein
VLYADHPTIVQRIAMVRAWERQAGAGGARPAQAPARAAN